MQQLSPGQLLQAVAVNDDVIIIDMALPDSVATTHQWIHQFCALTGTTMADQEWGADRFQAHLRCGEIRLLLCIEWLCDAIWLEPDAGESCSTGAIAARLVDNVSSQSQ